MRGLGGLALGLVLVGVVLVHTVPFVGMAWGALSGRPGIGLIRDIRAELLEQTAFRETLVAHEREALRRHRTGGAAAYQARHLVEIDLGPMGAPTFEDTWAVRVRTDVVDNTPYTAFLARPGVVMEENDVPFFSRQCGGNAVCEQAIRLAGGLRDVGVTSGLLTTYYLNITERDATSRVTVGTSPMETATWAQETRARHASGEGRQFSAAQ